MSRRYRQLGRAAGATAEVDVENGLATELVLVRLIVGFLNDQASRNIVASTFLRHVALSVRAALPHV